MQDWQPRTKGRHGFMRGGGWGADLGPGHSRLAHPPPALPAEEWEPAMVSYGCLRLQGAAASTGVYRWGLLLRVKPHLQPDRERQLLLLAWPTTRNCGHGASPESPTTSPNLPPSFLPTLTLTLQGHVHISLPWLLWCDFCLPVLYHLYNSPNCRLQP